jgi:hypothetical protein
VNVAHCHRCPLRARSCSGPCACTVDGCDIRDHAKANYCPQKKFGDGVTPAGWNAALPTYTDDEIAAMFERDKLGGCGCDPPGPR